MSCLCFCEEIIESWNLHDTFRMCFLIYNESVMVTVKNEKEPSGTFAEIKNQLLPYGKFFLEAVKRFNLEDQVGFGIDTRLHWTLPIGSCVTTIVSDETGIIHRKGFSLQQADICAGKEEEIIWIVRPPIKPGGYHFAVQEAVQFIFH